MKFCKVHVKYFYMANFLSDEEDIFYTQSNRMNQHKDYLSMCQVDLGIFVM